jgi:uncharacterized protein YjiK
MFLKPILLLSFSLSLSFGANSHTIAKIPEASGISYCQNTNTLMVANDEGTFYEISTEGKILYQEKLGKYDLEGVVCHDDEVIFAIEEGALLLVNRKSKAQKEYKLTLKGEKFKLNAKAGIEGLAFHKGMYYLSIQAKKKKDANLLVVKLGKKSAKIKEIIHHGKIDIAGLVFKENILYMLSDKKDALYLYDLKKRKVLKKVTLDKFAQEGISFDNTHSIYFADDEGTVKKYKVKEVLK